MKVLITLGPTQEPIDDVRYLTNASSGKMGAALAIDAIKNGHKVTIIHGPVTILLPSCKQIPVKTTQEMINATLKELESGYDVLISTAAISDFTPVKTSGKIRSGKKLSLDLKPTPKLIDKVRKKFPKLFVVGFKAEFGLRRDELETKAKKFRKQKKLDMLVANDIEKDAFGSNDNEVIVAVGDVLKEFEQANKIEIARYIWNEIELHKK